MVPGDRLDRVDKVDRVDRVRSNLAVALGAVELKRPEPEEDSRCRAASRVRRRRPHLVVHDPIDDHGRPLVVPSFWSDCD